MTTERVSLNVWAGLSSTLMYIRNQVLIPQPERQRQSRIEEQDRTRGRRR